MHRRDFVGVAGLAAVAALPASGQNRRVLGRETEGRGERPRTEPFPDDPHRPRYHFLPPKFWMNDPNGLIFHRGYYHLFYQHNPGAAVWGDMHWGHAVSQDLITWRNLPMALAPTPGGYDKDGVFSGCAVVNGSEPTVIYTGTKPEVQAIATSSDLLLERWTKYEGNPVISAPPVGLAVTGFRDPYVWREGGEWLMALGSGIQGKGGCVLLYSSADLRKWEYLHPLIESSDQALGTMWECPSFFPLGGKHVLLVSPIPLRKSLWAVGAYANRRFQAEKWGSLDDGGHFYAPQAFLDQGDRRVMFGWSWEGRAESAQVKAGWAGAQSLPRVLTLREDGGLRQEPHSYCRRLIRYGKSVKESPIGDALQEELKTLALTDAGRLDLVIEPADGKEIDIAFYRAPDGAEETVLRWQADPGEIAIDRSKSSLSAEQNAERFAAPLKLEKRDVLRVTMYFDRSLVEIYVNENVCLCTRVYPTRRDSVGMQIRGGGKKSMVREVTWRPISLRTS